MTLWRTLPWVVATLTVACPLACDAQDASPCGPPWTNDILINPDCYSVRDVTIAPGQITVGHFDRPYPEGNPCTNGKDARNKAFYLYTPAGTHASYRLFVVIHGTFGDPKTYLEDVALNNQHKTPYTKAFFDQEGIMVLAPHLKFWRDGCRVDIFDTFIWDKGGPAPTGASHRSDMWLLSLIDYLIEQTSGKLKAERFDLYGHSKGGQFVSMFAAIHPERLRAAVAAGAGWYLGEAATIDRTKTDLRLAHGVHPQLNALFHTTRLGVVVGKKDLYRRRCAAMKYVCNAVKRFCDFDERPFFNCQEAVWSAPATIPMTNGEPTPTGTLAENPCAAPAPAQLGTASCPVTFAWVDSGSHHGTTNYPAAAEILFGSQ